LKQRENGVLYYAQLLSNQCIFWEKKKSLSRSSIHRDSKKKKKKREEEEEERIDPVSRGVVTTRTA
jgi:hypothetical protein